MNNFKTGDAVWVEYLGQIYEGVISPTRVEIDGYKVQMKNLYKITKFYEPEHVFRSKQSCEDYLNNRIKEEKDIIRQMVCKQSVDTVVDYIYTLQKEINY